nr:monothiol glutaredoxin-s6 [Quercus suber]
MSSFGFSGGVYGGSYWVASGFPGLVAEKPVVIFSKSSCCMSHSINSLICSFGANPTVYELDQIPNGRQIERALLQLGCQSSVPAVFIGQEFIGGANEVMSLQVRNELVPLLIKSKAIWIWNKSK